MWIEYNPNPAGRRVGDCSVRAVSAALGADWETAYDMLCDAGYNMADMPSSDGVWGAVLRQHGFYRVNLPDRCPDCYTVAMFSRDNPDGTYVLGTGNHAVCVKQGNIYDAWDSSNEIPAYAWYKEE